MQSLTEVRLLLAVVTLAEELNFTRAAKVLDISQSTMTRRISAVEKRYRIKLFERDHANVKLTESGRAFVEEARLSLIHNERAVQVARDASEGIDAILTIGRSPFADPLLTSTLLSVHLPMYPNLKLNLHSDFTPDLVHDLSVSKLDIAFIANPAPNKKLTMTKVTESPLYIVLPEESALAELKVVTLKDLQEQTWITFERKAHPRVYDAIFRRAHEEDIVVRDGFKFLDAEEAAQLVSENMGVAFLTEAGARRLSTKGAVVRPLSDPELRNTICIASRADNKSKLVSEFTRAFMRRAGQVFNPPQLSLPMTG